MKELIYECIYIVVPGFYKMCLHRKSKYENIIFLILLLFGLFFIIGRFTPTVKLIEDFVYRFSYSSLNLTNSVFCFTENFVNDIKSVIHIRYENITYKQKNQELTDKLRNYEAMVKECDDLSKLLKLTKIENTISVFARLSIKGPNEWYKWFIINKGENDGLYNELPVLMFNKKRNALCAVGRIIETYASSSKVVLITNPAYALPVKIKDRNINCLAEGFGSNLLRITYIPHYADVKAGDEIVVSELSSVFQKDTPVGVITDVLEGESSVDFKTAKAKVFFEADNVYEAIICVPETKICGK
ncbi:MAG: rod shape-determining protein MreC [Endomicrobium sp.]|nr:rod shape-determining protein MreC [Endomicrobium sp.]